MQNQHETSLRIFPIIPKYKIFNIFKTELVMIMKRFYNCFLTYKKFEYGVSDIYFIEIILFD